jgi:5-methylcytosine-specific restriction endonuclease McrA
VNVRCVDEKSRALMATRCVLTPLHAGRRETHFGRRKARRTRLLQFGTSEEHVQLIERARALLSRARPGVTLGELHLEAMKLLVASLEKRRFAVTGSPRQRGASDPKRSKSASGCSDVTAREQDSESAKRRSRYIPAAQRREVYRRDAGRCAYVDARGERCGETKHLELHHLKPFTENGSHDATNLALRCAAHNALAAEEYFGKAHVAQKRDALRHESQSAIARQQRAR